MVTFHAHITSDSSWQAPGPGAHAMTHEVTLPAATGDDHVLTFGIVKMIRPHVIVYCLLASDC